MKIYRTTNKSKFRNRIYTGIGVIVAVFLIFSAVFNNKEAVKDITNPNEQNRPGITQEKTQENNSQNTIDVPSLGVMDIITGNGKEGDTVVDKLENAGLKGLKEAFQAYGNGDLQTAQDNLTSIIATLLDNAILTSAFGLEIDYSKIEAIENEDGTITNIIPDEYKLDGHISIVNVGMGNCTIVESNGVAMIIDAGEYNELNYEVINSALRFFNVKEVKYIVASHPHKDHIGMISSIIVNYGCENLIIPDCEADDLSYNVMISQANMYGVNIIKPEVGDTFEFEKVKTTVLSPSRGANYGNLNDYSLCLLTELGGVKLFTSGDATEYIERNILESGKDVKADILLVPHHGSFASSNKEFIEKIDADVAIMSIGENDLGFPSKKTVDTYNALGYKQITNDMTSEEIKATEKPLYRTDITGGLYVYIKDGKYYTLVDQELVEMVGASMSDNMEYENVE